jgi:hypothetical protein
MKTQRKTATRAMGRVRPALALAAALLLLALTAAPTTADPSQTLTVTKAGSATGTVTSSPAGIDCGSACEAEYPEGETVTLTGAGGANAKAVEWEGCDAVSPQNRCEVTMSEAKLVTARFDLVKRKLTVAKAGSGTGTVTSSPAGIDCGSVCEAEYDSGTEVTLSAALGPDTEAVKWSGCGSVDGEGKCEVTLHGARTVTATFSLAQGELKVGKGGLGTGTVTSSPAGISCGSTCAFAFDEGATVTLTGAPTGETEPVKWTGCDEVTSEGRCVVAMSVLREVGAVFNVKGPTLTISKLGSGSGTVTSSPAAIECGAACMVNFPKDSSVTLKGVPGLHAQPVKWAGCDAIVGAGECLVTMSSAREVTATFSLEPAYVEYTVSINIKGSGTGSVQSFPPGISCPGDCSEQYVFKTPVTLIATADGGSEFAHWSGGSCSGSGSCERKINSSRLVNAVFAAVGNRTLTVSKAGDGQGAVASANVAGIDCGQTCTAEFDAKTKVTLRATPAQGSTFTGWSEEGCSGTESCRVQMSAARNVTATFEKLPVPPAAQCLVPNVKGKTLARARAAIRNANCLLGKVKRPKGVKLGQLRVTSFSPAAGSVLAAGSRVSLKLARPGRR